MFLKGTSPLNRGWMGKIIFCSRPTQETHGSKENQRLLSQGKISHHRVFSESCFQIYGIPNPINQNLSDFGEMKGLSLT